MGHEAGAIARISFSPSRRDLLIGAAAAAVLPGAEAWAVDPLTKPVAINLPQRRALVLHHMYLGDKVRVGYVRDGRYDLSALKALDQAMRDTIDKTGMPIDPRLYDYMFALQKKLNHTGPIEVYSAYRSPETNAKWAAKSRAVAKNSYHLKGQAVDIAFPGRDLRDAALAAKGLKLGGVGFYSKRSKFVHIDTGPVRHWNI